MKIKLLSLIILICSCQLILHQDAFGQDSTKNTAAPAAKRQQKLKSLEILYIGRELDLTAEEAKLFWPVFDQYTEETEALINRRRKARKEVRNIQLQDKDAAAQKDMTNEFRFEKELINIKMKYRDEFMKILPPQKVSQFFKAEREFRNLIYKQLRERREQRNKQRISTK